MNMLQNMINELNGLANKKVKIFGQPTTLDNRDYENTGIINTVDILEGLKEYEVSDENPVVYTEDELRELPISELLDILELDDTLYNFNDIEEAINNDEYYRELNASDYIEFLYNCGELEEVDCNNTYNWASPLSNHIDFKIYKNLYNDTFIVELKAHLYGDVRGNYTECCYLQFDNDYEFLECLSENSYKQICIEILGDYYYLSTNMFKEEGQFDIYCDELCIEKFDVYLQDSDTLEGLTISLTQYLESENLI